MMRLFYLLVILLVALPKPVIAGSCSDGSPSIPIFTGQDSNTDGLDDNWMVLVPGGSQFEPALIGAPFAGWRGSLSNTGSFNQGFRYPVLGDGRWLRPSSQPGTYVYELRFDLDGCPNPTLAGEWDADNTIEILLNGNPILASNPSTRPPLPWLSNGQGIAHPDADPVDGLLHPTCDAPPLRCDNPEDEFREIHFLEITAPDLFELSGENVLTVEVLDTGVVGGMLMTGGAGTSLLSGASVRCCHPERPPGAAVATDLSIAKSAEPEAVEPGAALSYSVVVTNNGPGLATAVTLRDVLPTDVTFVATDPAEPTCTFTGGEVVCVLGDLLPTASAEVMIEVLVASGAAGSIVNTATVTSSAPRIDPDPTPDSATVQTLVLASSPLEIPTLSEWGLCLLGLVLAGLAIARIRRS